MSKDFSQHLNIISQFRGKVLTKEFEPLFAVATKHVPKTEKFLLKMELKRLAGPCTRLIDLRGNVDGECRAYEHDTRTHYLDPLAIRVFEENIEQYNGYTFGVYEAVNNTENNFRVIYQKEKRGIQNQTTAETTKIFEKLHYPATISQFGPYFNRSEERMNFAITINAVFENKKTLEVLSSDISISGCKIRVKGVPPIKVGEQIILEFF